MSVSLLNWTLNLIIINIESPNFLHIFHNFYSMLEVPGRVTIISITYVAHRTVHKFRST